MNNELKNFIQNHRINVLDDNKRAHKRSGVSTEFFRFPEDYNKMTATQYVQHETERLYTVEIAESELERIAEFEEQVFGNMRTQGHYNLFETLMGQKEEEYKLRNKYTAVRKAYEQYSTMLKLAQSGEL